jgi:hypothetical protein
MTQPALDPSAERTTSLTVLVATQRDQGLQMRLFSSHAPDVIDAEVDLRVTDDLAGMYYIG